MSTSPVKLWHYATLARMWSWALVTSAVLLLGVAFALRATTDAGIDLRYSGIVVGVSGITGVLGYPMLKLWLGRQAMPSLRLPRATAATGPRRLPAAPGDWRRWRTVMTAVLSVGGTMTMAFLIGVLGGGGTAEGVVVGFFAAWGIATLDDARLIDRAEHDEGRRYYAAVARPVAVGDEIVWTASGESTAVATPATKRSGESTD